MRKTIFLFVILTLCCTCLCSCSGCETEDRTGFTIASWNVQNLFDAVNDGTEYSEYKRSSGWTDADYRARLATSAQVLNSGNLRGAEIIVLNEVENARVTEDLMGRLDGRNFLWYAAASEEGGAISLAIISSIPMISVTTHSVPGARPVIAAHFNICSTDVFVLAVHAKSNLGDDSEVVQFRSLLGRAVEDIIQMIREDYPSALIVLAGDFNEDPWTGNVVRNMDNWRCFWDDSDLGSYLYDEVWHCYDNILLSADFLEGWGVVTEGLVTNTDGRPNRWDPETRSGVSDHLPIWVKVRLI